MHGRVLVGADGVNGRIARDAGLGGGILYGIALEGNGPLPRRAARARATVELGVVPGGYGWVFPKADHANYGVGGWAAEGPRLRAHLRRLCAEHGVDDDAADRPAGPPAADPADDAAPRAARSLLVGDAAGLVDPLSGDGIYEALVSARLAAEAILDGDARRATSTTLARRARPLRRHVLEGEARARPAPAGGVRDRAHPGRLARDRRAAQRRRRAPERRARPGAAAAAPAGAPLKRGTKPADSSPATPYGPERPPPARRRARRERHPPQARTSRRCCGATARSRRSPSCPPLNEQNLLAALEAVTRVAPERLRQFHETGDLDIAYTADGPAALPRQRLPPARRDLVRVPRHPARRAELRAAEPAARRRAARRTSTAASSSSPARPARARRRRSRR